MEGFHDTSLDRGSQILRLQSLRVVRCQTSRRDPPCLAHTVFICREECFYDSPLPCQRRFQNRFRAFAPSFYFIFAGTTCSCHVDVIVNASLSCIYVFSLAAGSGKYSLFFWFMQSTVWGGGYRRNTRSSSRRHAPAIPSFYNHR